MVDISYAAQYGKLNNSRSDKPAEEFAETTYLQ